MDASEVSEVPAIDQNLPDPKVAAFEVLTNLIEALKQRCNITRADARTAIREALMEI